MELKDQVVNLELSKRLKELGVKQESLFYWIYIEHFPVDDIAWGEWKLVNKTELDEHKKIYDYLSYSAFTVAELLDKLNFGFYLRKGNRGYTCGSGMYGYGTKVSNNSSDACAKMLIYLLENKLN